MFSELRAVQIEVPGDVVEMRKGSGEAPAHKAGASLQHTYCKRHEVAEAANSANVLPLPAWTICRFASFKTSCFGFLV
jgi:hypothetical protein